MIKSQAILIDKRGFYVNIITIFSCNMLERFLFF